MNFNLPNIPQRETKPRNKGLTMVMDKGLSLQEAQNLVASSENYTDIVKLGFGTSLITKDLQKKLDLYKEANIKTYFGGTLFEAFVARNMFDEYRQYLDQYGMEYCEVSDGVLPMKQEDKCHYISKLSENYTVLSEVGYKTGERTLSEDLWVENLNRELAAGAWKVITEARESGTIGIYNSEGAADEKLIKLIAEAVKSENILWEAPLKSQQTWFIKLLGPEVSLGNICPREVIALETLRLGLRGDTVLDFLD